MLATRNSTRAMPLRNCSRNWPRKVLASSIIPPRTNRYSKMIEGEGDKQQVRPLFSIPEILSSIKEVGRRGLSVKRFKGWAK